MRIGASVVHGGYMVAATFQITVKSTVEQLAWDNNKEIAKASYETGVQTPREIPPECVATPRGIFIFIADWHIITNDNNMLP